MSDTGTYAFTFTWPVLLIRSRGGMGGLVNSVKDAIVGVNPEINIQLELLRTQIHDSLGWDEWIATLCGFFGAVVLLLAAIGLYGVISYMIAQRTNEIGIRMALGAPRAGVVRLILGEAAILIGSGFAVGIGLALAGAYSLSWSFYGVNPHDPLTLAVTLAITMVILAAVGFAASFGSARRVSRLDPMVALRYE